MAAISHIVSSGGKTDGGSKSASHHYNTNSVQVQDSTNDYFFIPGEHCPLVRAVDNMAINIERHLNERLAQTTQVEDGGQGHVGLLAERVPHARADGPHAAAVRLGAADGRADRDVRSETPADSRLPQHPWHARRDAPGWHLRGSKTTKM